MGATAEPAVERESEGGGRGAEEEEREELEDVERGEVGFQRGVAGSHQNRTDFHASMMQGLDSTNPLRIVINGGRRVTTPSPAHASIPRSTPPPSHASVPRSTPPPPHASVPRSTPPPPLASVARSTPTPSHASVPRSTPTPQSTATLNSRNYTNKISLFLFLLHLVIAFGLVGFLVFKGVQGLIEASEDIKRKEKAFLKHFVPQVEAASFLSITLAFAWQKAVREWPQFMVHLILWGTFGMSLSAGVLLLCFQTPPTDGVGVCFIAFAIGNGLYACWVSQRTRFCCSIFLKSMEPVSKFRDINRPIYVMLGAGFLWMSFWILAVIGALNFYFPPLIIIAMVLSLAWVTEVMRNIANITVSRVIALFYLRGMESSAFFCFQRALTYNLGSACLGSLFVPAIEALRIVARGLNLLEGEDEFMFSCAHCCLRVMDSIFRHGNGWAFVQIAAYGKGFVKASQDTWELFEKQDMERIVDSDITSSICFLTGVCSGSICVIVVAAWTFAVHKSFTATISLLAFFVGYLMTRIAMALPHACVSCYYVCYAENPEKAVFGDTIKAQRNVLKLEQDVVVPTPRVPARFRRE